MPSLFLLFICLFQKSEELYQEIPAHLDGLDFKFLIG